MLFDYSKIKVEDRYKLISGSIIPRPIAWIVTQNNEGVVNIAPFSYFTGLSSNPPTFVVSIGHKSDGSEKDTLRNIRDSKKCTLCMVKEEDLELMHFSSKEINSSISEAELFDIKTIKIEKDFPPMISSSPIAFFCEFSQEIKLKESKTIPLVLEIKKEFIDDDVVDERLRVSFNPVARLGGNYAFLSKHIDLPKIP
jgi:flavin reductase (DIM6/NTAB) family NADH-FMN oxidoreductase RutF